MATEGITPFIGPLYAALDTFNREITGFIPSVTRNTVETRVKVGQEVRSAVVSSDKPRDTYEGNSSKDEGNGAADEVVFTIEKSRYVPIKFSGEEDLGLTASGTYDSIVLGKIQDAYRQLINEMEEYIAAKAIAGATRAVGTPGTTPFGTAGNLMDFANLAKILDDNGAPRTDRNLVVNTTAMANLRGMQTILLKANEAGSADFLRTGYLNSPITGFGLFDSAGLVSHSSGTAKGLLINNASGVGKGSRIIDVDTGTGTVLPGDFITIDGDTNKYIVNVGGTDPTSLKIGAPGLLKDAADNAAIALGGSYLPCVAFQKNAIVLGTRIPSAPRDGDAAEGVEIVTDPYTGIQFEARLYKQHRQNVLEIGIAYGAVVAKSDNVAVLLG